MPATDVPINPRSARRGVVLRRCRHRSPPGRVAGAAVRSARGGSSSATRATGSPAAGAGPV